ncbi:MAG: 2-phospho-L-lactate transferase CofD [Rhodospirillales bacterium]|nr:2-phospho-L-lactate transferase CofD [Rhodospirillales bacterium]
MPWDRDLVVALSGGIGGAKLALGLSRIVEPGNLMVVTNTGDDFEHLGLAISPDIDTMLYTLAGIDNQETGWGRADETWNFLAALTQLGGEDWFRLGDKDLAIHVERTRRLAAGETLSQITADFCQRLGIASHVVPMSDDPVRTQLGTGEGWLSFQDYFVRQRCLPVVTEIDFAGVAEAEPNPLLLDALAHERLRAVVICPSNPLISIGPILAVPGVWDALVAATAPIVAVAPIIGGQSVKGPTAKMMRELGIEVSAAEIGRRYGELLAAYVVDHEDLAECADLDLRIVPAQALMTTADDRVALAEAVLDAADESWSRAL